MGIQRYDPPEDLAPYFREFYYCDFQQEGTSDIPIVDDGCYDLVFFKERNSEFQYGPDRLRTPLTAKVFTIHQSQPPYRILLNSELSFFTIKVQPWLNSTIFPLGEPGGIIETKTFLNKDTQLFHERLFTDIPDEERFTMTAAWLREALSTQEIKADPLVKELCKTISREQGKLTVTELEATFGQSRQYLNTRFKDQVYYPLKKFIIIVRILDLIKRRINQPDASFTQLALEYGYFDQAHFNRDFKRVTGLTPRFFFKYLAPFLERHRL